MSNDRLPASALKSNWGEAAKRAARPVESEPSRRRRQQQAATRRTVGVYERPAQRRTKLSLPLLVIVILATLISVVLSARFLF